MCLKSELEWSTLWWLRAASWQILDKVVRSCSGQNALAYLLLIWRRIFIEIGNIVKIFFVALLVARNKLTSLSLTSFWLNQHLLTVLNQSACREQERSILFVFNVTRLQRKEVLKQRQVVEMLDSFSQLSTFNLV